MTSKPSSVLSTTTAVEAAATTTVAESSIDASNANNKNNNNNNNNTEATDRRSARVSKRDPVIAPGFGTLHDLQNLAESLHQSLEFVTLVMSAQGRGVAADGGQRRRRKKRGALDDDPSEEETAAAGNAMMATAWASFLDDDDDNDDGGTTKKGSDNDNKKKHDAPAEESSSIAAAAASSSSSSADNVRDYDLPLQPLWLKAAAVAAAAAAAATVPPPKSKKAKKRSKTKASNSASAAAAAAAANAGGILVQTGTLDTSIIGRQKRTMNQPCDLMVPTVLFREDDKRFSKVISSCNACHALALSHDGTAVYGWGRNDGGQLHPSLPTNVVLPTLLEQVPTGVTFVDGAVGKHHSLLLSKEGKVYAIGSNKVGQCGINSQAMDEVKNWKPCVFRPLVGSEDDLMIVQVACGEAFSVALSQEGDLYTTGSSEYGQLGNGETGEYFVTASKLAFANCQLFLPRTNVVQVAGTTGGATESSSQSSSSSSSSSMKPPKLEPVVIIDSKTGTPTSMKFQRIACGKHHALAVEAATSSTSTPPPPPRVVSWGCGNYGCLGHGVQADQYTPRIIATLDNKALFSTTPIVEARCGASCSMVMTASSSSSSSANGGGVGGGGHLYYWGKHRSVGEATMRPSLLQELAHNAHVVTQAAAGNQTVICSTANAVTVGWGQGPHGELGFVNGKKSSAKPQFLSSLDSCRVMDLACGYGTTYFLVQKDDAEDEKAIASLPIVDHDAVQAWASKKAWTTTTTKKSSSSSKGRKK